MPTDPLSPEDAGRTEGEWSHRGATVEGPLGVTVAFCPGGCVVSTTGNYGISPREAEANARYIVRAVNSHDALVEALRTLYEETADYIRINHLGEVHHNRSMQLARAALEKARPK